MNRKILFVGSLQTKKNCYDGERIKTSLVHEAFSNFFSIDLINLSRSKFLQTLKFVFLIIFKRRQYRYIIISKAPQGAVILHRILRLLNVNMGKVHYFEIGPLLFDLTNKNPSIKKLFMPDKSIIVESPSMAAELQSIGYTNVSVYPNFRKIYSLPPHEQTIHGPVSCIYFSRIEAMKGIFDLIHCIKEINVNTIKFTLDVYGMFNTKKCRKHFFKEIEGLDYIQYKGKLSLTCKKDYLLLEHYNLHIFPTLYSEGIPGTLIDFIIAGVPTLSSTFPRSKEILDETDSYFFDQGKNNELIKQLEFIYENPHSLNIKRKNLCLKKETYSFQRFCDFIERRFLNEN